MRSPRSRTRVAEAQAWLSRTRPRSALRCTTQDSLATTRARTSICCSGRQRRAGTFQFGDAISGRSPKKYQLIKARNLLACLGPALPRMRHSPGSEPPPGIQGREEPANLSFLFRSTRITCGVWQALGWKNCAWTCQQIAVANVHRSCVYEHVLEVFAFRQQAKPERSF